MTTVAPAKRVKFYPKSHVQAKPDTTQIVEDEENPKEWARSVMNYNTHDESLYQMKNKFKLFKFIEKMRVVESEVV